MGGRGSRLPTRIGGVKVLTSHDESLSSFITLSEQLTGVTRAAVIASTGTTADSSSSGGIERVGIVRHAVNTREAGRIDQVGSRNAAIANIVVETTPLSDGAEGTLLSQGTLLETGRVVVRLPKLLVVEEGLRLAVIIVAALDHERRGLILRRLTARLGSRGGTDRNNGSDRVSATINRLVANSTRLLRTGGATRSLLGATRNRSRSFIAELNSQLVLELRDSQLDTRLVGRSVRRASCEQLTPLPQRGLGNILLIIILIKEINRLLSTLATSIFLGLLQSSAKLAKVKAGRELEAGREHNTGKSLRGATLTLAARLVNHLGRGRSRARTTLTVRTLRAENGRGLTLSRCLTTVFTALLVASHVEGSYSVAARRKGAGKKQEKIRGSTIRDGAKNPKKSAKGAAIK